MPSPTPADMFKLKGDAWRSVRGNRLVMPKDKDAVAGIQNEELGIRHYVVNFFKGRDLRYCNTSQRIANREFKAEFYNALASEYGEPVARRAFDYAGLSQGWDVAGKSTSSKRYKRAVKYVLNSTTPADINTKAARKFVEPSGTGLNRQSSQFAMLAKTYGIADSPELEAMKKTFLKRIEEYNKGLNPTTLDESALTGFAREVIQRERLGDPELLKAYPALAEYAMKTFELNRELTKDNFLKALLGALGPRPDSRVRELLEGIETAHATEHSLKIKQAAVSHAEQKLTDLKLATQKGEAGQPKADEELISALERQLSHSQKMLNNAADALTSAESLNDARLDFTRICQTVLEEIRGRGNTAAVLAITELMTQLEQTPLTAAGELAELGIPEYLLKPLDDSLRRMKAVASQEHI